MTYAEKLTARAEAKVIRALIDSHAYEFRRFRLPVSEACDSARAHYHGIVKRVIVPPRHGGDHILTPSERINRHNSRHRDRQRARAAFAYAVKMGYIVRPAACSVCAVACTPHGHHDDYAKPLEVRWLCRPCHVAHHTEVNRQRKQRRAA